jgi:hypothetical protein
VNSPLVLTTPTLAATATGTLAQNGRELALANATHSINVAMQDLLNVSPDN